MRTCTFCMCAPTKRMRAHLLQHSWRAQGQLAFQTGKLQRAGDLTKWLLEVVPCTAEDAAAGASGEACEMRRQAAAMQAYVVAGMESRGSSMVDTPRQSLQLLQAYQCNHLLPRLEKLEASYNSYFDTKNTRAKREQVRALQHASNMQALSVLPAAAEQQSLLLPPSLRQALEEMLDNYVSMLEVFKQERDRLDKDAASTQRTLRELGGQREHLWRALRVSAGSCCCMHQRPLSGAHTTSTCRRRKRSFRVRLRSTWQTRTGGRSAWCSTCSAPHSR